MSAFSQPAPAPAAENTFEQHVKRAVMRKLMGCGCLVFLGGGALAFLLVAGWIASLLPKAPGEAAFRRANEQIVSDSRGATSGNGPAAVKLAEQFRERIELMQGLMFSGGDKDRTISLTHEKFLTYCELRDESVCFLVHVPQLKNYKAGSDVRKALIDLAWTCARSVTKELRAAKDRRLAVGLRGSLMYGGLAIGMGEATPAIDNDSSVTERKLYDFFLEPPTPTASVALPAPLPPTETAAPASGG